VPAASIAASIRSLPESQLLNRQTRAIHAAAYWEPGPGILALREDVGRHNAVDKVVGRHAMEGELPLGGRVLMVSGRASFEIVQKAVVAGIPVIAAVSAPSTLAVDLAAESNATLVGFLRPSGFNVYAGRERIAGL